jgi:integrase
MGRPRHQKGSLQIRKQGNRRVWVALYRDSAGIRRWKTLGLVSKMQKTTAEQEMAKLVAPVNEISGDPVVADFVNGVYLPFCRETWKDSTRETTEQRLRTHVVDELGEKRVSELRRDMMQQWLKRKASDINPRTNRLNSYSLVAHLRWDLKHILDLAVRDEIVRTNQAEDLSIPRVQTVVNKRHATPKDIATALAALGLRERLIMRLAYLVGLRPGEILALQWRHISGDRAQIDQRVYRGKVDTVKNQTPRTVALPPSVVRDLERWAELCFDLEPNAWVFSTETGRPGNKDSFWRHAIEPRLRPFGLTWLNFQVLRRTWSTTAAGAGISPKVRADQLGHGVDVDINEYTQVPFDQKLAAVKAVELLLEGSGSIQ